jgi:hypothetical protein
VPLDGEAPTFPTVTVYVMVSPGAALLGLCTFAIVRSLDPTVAGLITTPSVSKDLRLV